MWKYLYLSRFANDLIVVIVQPLSLNADYGLARRKWKVLIDHVLSAVDEMFLA